jgi:hypothetical protein
MTQDVHESGHGTLVGVVAGVGPEAAAGGRASNLELVAASVGDRRRRSD